MSDDEIREECIPIKLKRRGIVYCEDCKYWTQQLGNYKGDAYGCCGRLTTRPYDFDMTADDFCSRGELK